MTRTRHSTVRFWSLFVGLIVATVVVVWQSYNGGTYTMVITNQYAQNKAIEALARREAAGLKTVNVENLLVTFLDNEMMIDATVWGIIRNRTIRTDIHVTGVPVYHDDAFFFHPTKPVTFANMQIEHSKTWTVLTGKLSQIAADHGWEEVTAAFKIDALNWTTAHAQKTLVNVLTTHPIYTPKNDHKGIAIKIALKKIEIVNGELHLVLSVISFGLSIILGLVIFLAGVGLVIVMVTNPEIAMTLGLLSFLDS